MGQSTIWVYCVKLLLLGKDGQLGFELQRALAPLGELRAVGRKQCDLQIEADISSTIRDMKPDVIINAAAYTMVDLAESEPDKAFLINSRAAALIGEEAARTGALVVHYSTDYVFNGIAEGFYSEMDSPSPLGVYGKSKLGGELALQCSGARHLIFRTSWVYGCHGANFAKMMLKLAEERNELNIVVDQVGAPTSTSLIADVTAHAIRCSRMQPALEGLYHLAAGGQTNWYAYASYLIDFARRSGRPIRVGANNIHPIGAAEYKTVAARPANSCLDTGKLSKAFDLYLPDWKIGVDYFLRQVIGCHDAS